MNKKITKVLSWMLSLAMLLSVITVPTKIVKADDQISVTVIIENNVYTKDDGATWDGQLVKETVEVSGEDSAFTAVDKAAKKANQSVEFTPSYYGGVYISGISGLSEYANNGNGGWMATINDWFTASGLADYTVANGGLKSGYVIDVQYTNDWGADIGSDWQNNSTALKHITVNNGTLSDEFQADKLSYTLNLQEGVTTANIVPTAVNKNFQVRIYLNEYKPESEEYYLAGTDIPVKTGDVLYVGIGNDKWPSMNYGAEETVYTFAVNIPEVLVPQKDKEAEPEQTLAEVNQEQFAKVYEETTNALLKGEVPTVSSIGGEWVIIGLARSGRITDEMKQAYYKNVCAYVKEKGSAKLNDRKVTDNARVILALTALGYDVTNVEGYNLLEPLADYDYATAQGVNGAIWTLIAMNSNNYQFPEVAGVFTPNTREKLTSYILKHTLEDGGITVDEDHLDIDLTCMAIDGWKRSTVVKDDTFAEDGFVKMTNIIKAIHKNDANYAKMRFTNAETVSQAIIALATANVNVLDEKEFTKGYTPMANLFQYYLGNGQFAHIQGGAANQMATEQAYLAMTAYYLYQTGNGDLFDMTKVAGNDKKSETAQTTDNHRETKAPKTGDHTNGIVFVTLFVSMALVVRSLRKKENN